MRKSSELSGKKFGRLTAIKPVGHLSDKDKTIMWECLCDCGSIVVVRSTFLRNGHSKSCGCLKSDITSERNKSNKQYDNREKGNRLYRIYWGMRSRCYNKSTRAYKYYGARGISICEQWLNSFDEFYNWSIDNGYSDDLTIDRINNDGNYCPENCRWATKSEQNANKRHEV